VVIGVHVSVCVSVCPPSHDCTPQCRISLSCEGNALYPVLSTLWILVDWTKSYTEMKLAAKKHPLVSVPVCMCVYMYLSMSHISVSLYVSFRVSLCLCVCVCISLSVYVCVFL